VVSLVLISFQSNIGRVTLNGLMLLAFSVCSFIVFCDLFNPFFTVSLIVSSVVGVVALDAIDPPKVVFSFFFVLATLCASLSCSFHP
jgi:hypothetical protein